MYIFALCIKRVRVFCIPRTNFHPIKNARFIHQTSWILKTYIILLILVSEQAMLNNMLFKDIYICDKIRKKSKVRTNIKFL